MAFLYNRPLPSPPSMANQSSQQYFEADPDMYRPTNPYFSPHSYLPFTHGIRDEPPTTLRGGTLLHKGFYDLLAMIPTPSPSRLFWGVPRPQPEIAGPRYDDIPAQQTIRTTTQLPPPVAAVTPRKGRRISKDMVSSPTGFVYAHLNNSCPFFSSEF